MQMEKRNRKSDPKRELFWRRVFILFSVVFSLSVIASAQSLSSEENQITQSYNTLLERAAKLYSSGRFDSAILLFLKAEERGAPPEVTAFNIGNCRYRAGDLPRAAAAYRRAIRLSPLENTSALLNLAAVFYRMGEYAEAAATYRRLLRSDPDQIDAWIFLAESCQRSGDPVCTQQALEKANRLSPDDVGIIYRLAEVHLGMKEFEEAISLIREAYKLYPVEIDFLFYIGDLYRVNKQWDAASEAYREGLSHNPENVDALYKLADVLVEGDHPFLAMEILQKVLLLKPDFSDAAVFLGNIAFDRGWLDRSEKAYVQAAELGNGEGIQGLRNIAYEAEREMNYSEALRLAQLALLSAPQDRSLREEIDYYKGQ